MDTTHDDTDTDIESEKATRTERGASLVEYALLMALIAVVCIAAVTTLGTTVNDTFTDADQKLGAAQAEQAD